MIKMAERLATRYHCSLRDKTGLSIQHTAGNGVPPRKCRYCSSRLTVERGLWGVFVWTGDGRYPREDAERTYVREQAAQDRADLLNETRGWGGYVVRWIPVTPPPADLTYRVDKIGPGG